MEILVVIAIIGILSSVVIPRLSDARDKGIDAAVKATVANLKPAAEIYYDDNFSDYTGLCADAAFADMVTSAKIAVDPAALPGAPGDGECIETAFEWAVWVNLRATTTAAFCVDATQEARFIPVQDSTAVDLTTCP